MSLKMIVLCCAGAIVILGGAGFGIYKIVNNKNVDENASTVEEKITGPQTTAKNISVIEARIDASPINFGTEKVVDAGYTATTYVKISSSTKISKVAIEELKVDNLESLGDCTSSEKDASTDNFLQGIGQRGYVSFKLTCRTGVSYSVDEVLATTGEWSGLKLLSYGGLTPPALSRSLSFDVAVKYDDGTMTKKTFSGTISGQALSNGDFGAGSISGQGDSY